MVQHSVLRAPRHVPVPSSAAGGTARPASTRVRRTGSPAPALRAACTLLVSLTGLCLTPGAEAAGPLAARLGPSAAIATDAAAASTFNLTGGAGSLRLDFETFSARFDLALPQADDTGSGWRRAGWQLLGDYRFTALGGLRATGGLLGAGGAAASGSGLVWPAPSGPRSALGPRAGEAAARGQLWAGGLESGLATYLGVGYSLGNRPAGWGLSADLGLVGQRDPGEVRLGRSSGPGIDWLRELRLRPLLQVGASYAF